MKKFDPLQELDTSSNSAFVRAVDFVVSKPVDNNLAFQQVVLGYTPLVFRLCDIGVGKMRMDYATIEKVIAEYLDRPKRDGFNTHNLTPEQIKQIPTQICNPIAIIQSQTRLNSVIVLTELFETKSKTGKTEPTIVAVHFKNRKNDTWLKIQSIHGRTDEFLVDNLSGNLLLYLNREKCRNLMISHFTLERLRKLHKDNHRNERLQIIAEMCDLEIHKGRFHLKTFASIAGGNDLLQNENDHLYETDNNAKTETMQEEMHKGHYQLKTTASIAAREFSLQTDNDRLYETDNNAKSETMQEEMHKGCSLKTGVSAMEARMLQQGDNHTDNTAAHPQKQAVKRTIPLPTGYKTEEDLRLYRLETVKQRYLAKFDTLTDAEKAKLTAYEQATIEMWQNCVDEKQQIVLTNFYRNAADTIADGKSTLAPAMNWQTALAVLTEHGKNKADDSDYEIER